MKRCVKVLRKITLGTGALYIGMIKPRLFRRPERLPGKYYAHRGLHDNMSTAPENTMAAFQRAVDAGYGIEMDIQLTKDKQVVVAHDFNLKRICGENIEISDLTYTELQAYRVMHTEEAIPLFQDVLKMVNGKVPLIIELKVKNIKNEICELADDILQDYKGIYCIESFHPMALWWYRRNRPEVCRGQLSSNFAKDGLEGPGYRIMQNLLLNFLTAPDFISYDFRNRKSLSKNLCRNIFGCPSIAWTIHDERELKAARRYYDYYIFEGFEPEDFTEKRIKSS